MKLVRAVAQGERPLEAVQPNQVFLNQQAVALKDAFDYPGCELVKTKV
jgi:hypothetical protein